MSNTLIYANQYVGKLLGEYVYDLYVNLEIFFIINHETI